MSEAGSDGQVWAVLLAAGDGSRVRDYTSGAAGEQVPKQFWAPRGRDSMLRWALSRALAIAPRERIVAVVAEQHRRWWKTDLDDLPSHNVVVQPANRGTTPGILLPVFEVLRRDERAVVVILPSDHFVAHEPVLREALISALRAVSLDAGRLVLLGMEPTGRETDCGWIVPADVGGCGLTRPVAAFVEKPDRAAAQDLAHAGALLNSFILAARGDVLLRTCEPLAPHWLAGLRHWAARSERAALLAQLYAELAASDFSRDVLEQVPQRLRVLAVRGCGWSDLGVPERLVPFLLENEVPVMA